ncbi:Vesicle transport protein, Got1/SFT2-like,Major facilitator superfamily domain [Cinara cedri]|uniref:Vesicle transport protein n=1 Tax=Cinara cedri TaxID=506608 RepID=A0A5E4MZP3_9HEMI|nr:Vesicle transport protein, Got1/SFT2-like,Major facilitator superfamily domain [Cinara cedri]
MANLKLELDEYLSKGQKNKPNNGHVHIPKVFKKFLSNESGEQTENLLDPTQNKYFNFPTLSKTQRVMGFMVCVAISCLMFSLSALYLPVLLLKARKFAILYASGSIFAFASVSFLTGPLNHYKYVTSKEKLPFMFGYIITLLGTLYFSLWMKSTPYTLLLLTIHLVLIFWFLLNSIPFGQKGLSFFGRLCSSMVKSKVSNSLPV